MAKKLNFALYERKMITGPLKGKPAFVAIPTSRERVDFRSFTKKVARATTFTPEEVGAVLNLAAQMAREIVQEGDTVEFGDLGALTPTFSSKAVGKIEEFNANVHISNPKVRLIASTKYFTLTDVSYERVEPKKPKPKPAGPGGGSNPGGGGSNPGAGV